MTEVQDMIDSVLAGDAPRGELEQLARRFDLADDDRRQVDEFLRLLNSLDQACKTPLPDGAIDRAAATLRALKDEAAEGGETGAKGATDNETARATLDRYLNGEATRRQLEQAASLAGLDTELRAEIADVLAIDDRLSTGLHDLPVPEGAVDRLKLTLRALPPQEEADSAGGADDEDVQAAWGDPRMEKPTDPSASDEADAPPVFRPHRTYFEGPDVLAAGKGVREPEEDDSQRTDDEGEDDEKKP